MTVIFFLWLAIQHSNLDIKSQKILTTKFWKILVSIWITCVLTTTPMPQTFWLS